MTSTKDSVTLTRQIVLSQLQAISSDVYDIGVFDPAGNDGDGKLLLRHWTKEQISESLEWLRYRNAQGNAIWVRPHGEHAYTLIDDLSELALKELTPDFEPCVTVETSPGNFQVWLWQGEVMPAELGSLVAANLANITGGDRGAAAWNQFGRLAGFTNNKPKYRQASGLQPFVRLRGSRPKRRLYERAAAVLSGAKATLAAAVSKPQWSGPSARPSGRLKTLGQFHDDPRYAGDLHRADLAYATYALSHGLSDEDVRSAIAQRDLAHKGSSKRQSDYIERTIKKAASQAGRA